MAAEPTQADIAYATHRLLESMHVAEEVFEGHETQLLAVDGPGLHIQLWLNGQVLASFAGDHPVEVADAVASFLIHVTTRHIEE
jgi:diadenosine tetraphosphatase ApaH/serine/threonine PP2A family protein phosphatase